MSERVAALRAAAPWLAAPELGACVVGSAALGEACRRAGVAGPRVGDVDLAWALDVDVGEALLRARGVYVATTTANRARGTLAIKLDADRYEITSLRGAAPAGASLAERLALDLSLRDMTVGALAWRLADDALLDPLNGLAHWRAQRIVACGDPLARVREHPVRLLRYYRRAHEWGFALDGAIRRIAVDGATLATIPAEAASSELRSALLRCKSPGRFLHELHEAGALAPLAPELAVQFGPMPAGPVRDHPEVSQALHVTLALQWAGEATAGRNDEDRLTVLVAVLCHDLGKNASPAAEWPRHLGHETAGLPLVDALLDRLPSLADARTRRLARAVCALHLEMRRFHELRRGTLAELYEQWFKGNAFPVELFAIAVAADSGGRLDSGDAGARARATLERQVVWLREKCAGVDAGALWSAHQGDRASFATALHEARCRALEGERPD